RVDGIEFNRVDAGVLGAIGEPQRRIAERTAELEHALGCNGGGDHTENGAVLERVRAATVLGAVPQGLRTHLGERVGRFFRGHGLIGPQSVLSLPARGGWPRSGRVGFASYDEPLVDRLEHSIKLAVNLVIPKP